MNKDDMINYVPFQVILLKYFETYMQMYGDSKFQEIADKVNNSPLIAKALKQSEDFDSPPTAQECTEIVLSTTSFIISKVETHVTASVAFLAKWKAEVGDARRMSSDVNLNQTLFGIIEKGEAMKVLGNDHDSFFKRFRKELEAFIQSDEYRAVARQLFIDKPVCIADFYQSDIMNMLRYEDGTVCATAKTYADLFVDVFRKNFKTKEEEAMRHIILLYGTDHPVMRQNAIYTEQLIKESQGCVAKLIFCLLCEDRAILEVLSSGTDVASIAIEAVYETVYDAASGYVVFNSHSFKHWVNEYMLKRSRQQYV